MSTTLQNAQDEANSVIGKTYHIKMDRPIGTIHPKHPTIAYPINYGYIEGLMGGDDEEQDVYIIDATEPLEEAVVTIIAVICRFDDVETKWVGVVDSSRNYADEEIKQITHFQEQFYTIQILRKTQLD